QLHVTRWEPVLSAVPRTDPRSPVRLRPTSSAPIILETPRLSAFPRVRRGTHTRFTSGQCRSRGNRKYGAGHHDRPRSDSTSSGFAVSVLDRMLGIRARHALSHHVSLRLVSPDRDSRHVSRYPQFLAGSLREGAQIEDCQPGVWHRDWGSAPGACRHDRRGSRPPDTLVESLMVAIAPS